MRLRSNGGQIIIEYILLLVIAATIAALILRGLASRSEDHPGIMVKRWKEIQTEIGNEIPDKCTGDSCSH